MAVRRGKAASYLRSKATTPFLASLMMRLARATTVSMLLAKCRVSRSPLRVPVPSAFRLQSTTAGHRCNNALKVSKWRLVSTAARYDGKIKDKSQ